ncbi:MAG: hypothetical protein QOE57_1608, partial [Acidimicrobiaceae bacterium]|nr:hypothetical protein [Acidimicrobiaceae bacterium]
TPPPADGPDPITALGPGASREQRQQARKQQRELVTALTGWWLDRMVAAAHQTREKLTFFWHGHWATSVEKVEFAGLMLRQQQTMYRLGAGDFGALVHAMVLDPALIWWLDGHKNAARAPNENLARELMELFTLGIGNYSETDVQEAARAFTGWTLSPTTGEFVLNARRHDSGSKTVLGLTGNLDGTDVVRLITHHPASSRFVVAKLWSHLAYPVPTTDPIVGPLAAGYAQDLDVTSLLRAIFLHPGFTSPTARQGLVKQPIEWVVGLARAFGVDADLKPTGGAAPATAAATGAPARSVLSNVLTQLAQEPFNPPSVGGWPQNTYWLNTATSLIRLQFAASLGPRLDLSWLTAVPANQRPAALSHRLSIDGWGQTTLAALNHVSSQPAALVALAVCAPEYILN